MGVLLYAILCATVPFKAKTLPELHKLILAGKFSFPDCLCESARDLISKLLHPVPHKRISLGEMKTHPWLSGTEEPIEDKRPRKKRGSLGKVLKLGYPTEYVIHSLRASELTHATAAYHLYEMCKN